MSESYTARPIEARVFRARWDDGQLDLFLGVGAIGVGVLWAFDLVALGAVVPALLAVLWTPVRRTVIEPRAGWVEFSAPRVSGNRRKLVATTWLGVGTLAVFVIAAYFGAAAAAGPVQDLAAAIPATLVGLMAAIVGVGLRIGRFLWYAAVFAAAGIALASAGYEPETAMIAAGAVVTVSGALLLARFLRQARRAEDFQ